MKCTKITSQLQKVLHVTLAKYVGLQAIVSDIARHATRVVLVGGAVRDLLLDKPLKDLDIEVHGMTIDQLECLLRAHGNVELVGKAFGVVRLHGLDVDWAVPRIDTIGRKPTVRLDPGLDVRSAFRRRDLTINAMGIDLLTGELLDPFNGLNDLHAKILRATDEVTFVEDPLRFFRVMQTIGRFECTTSPEIDQICRTMDISGVSHERIADEFEKLFLQSRRPSLGIRWLLAVGRLQEVLPEVAALIGVEQRGDWHPEGDVFEHTMQAIDAATASTFMTYDDPDDTLIVRYAALCHDLGKVLVTQKIDGIWRSSGHAQAGVPAAKKLLKRITDKKRVRRWVTTLVQYHMHPSQFLRSDAPLSSYKRLASLLAPIPMRMLVDLFCADMQGRNADRSGPLQDRPNEVDIFATKVSQADVVWRKEPPVLLGRDVLDLVAPGKKMGELLKKAYEIQLQEGIRDKEELKKRLSQACFYD